jgi:hypothetical protein
VRVTPIVCSFLRPNFEVEIVVSTFKTSRNAHVNIKRDADQILTESFESLLKSVFIINCFSLSKADNTI